MTDTEKGMYQLLLAVIQQTPRSGSTDSNLVSLLVEATEAQEVRCIWCWHSMCSLSAL